jgi:RNA polymerase sigma-70 factor (ECF subfamily)
VTSFPDLAARYWCSIHRVCWNLLPDRAAAVEVAEATFLDALEAFPRDVPSATSLYRMAVSKSLSRLPALPSNATRSLGVFLPRFDAHGRFAAAATDWSWLGDAAFGDVGAAVREVLLRLDPVDRAAFVLREVEELSTEEVAAVLGISPAHVRHRVHRASLILTGFLGQLFEKPALVC